MMQEDLKSAQRDELIKNNTVSNTSTITNKHFFDEKNRFERTGVLPVKVRSDRVSISDGSRGASSERMGTIRWLKVLWLPARAGRMAAISSISCARHGYSVHARYRRLPRSGSDDDGVSWHVGEPSG